MPLLHNFSLGNTNSKLASPCTLGELKYMYYHLNACSIIYNLYRSRKQQKVVIFRTI
jgi:hypothetical protein